ncbi:MAG: hypothetical protein H6Q05_3636 [Acidobacteria bacterium]|nr:hypothetical protein [Acidobacteriota bacterium]
MKILKGAVAGGIVFFLLGWLVYGVLLMNYMTANMNQCAARPMQEMIWWAMIASSLLTGLLLTMVLKWAGAKAILDGLKTGAVFGVLLASGMDLGFWSMTKMYNNFAVMVVDIVVYTLMMSVVGMLIVLLWGKDTAA